MLQALGTWPPDPLPPVAGGFSPRPPVIEIFGICQKIPKKKIVARIWIFSMDPHDHKTNDANVNTIDKI